jgi:hypothetical protein
VSERERYREREREGERERERESKNDFLTCRNKLLSVCCAFCAEGLRFGCISHFPKAR